MNARRTRTLAVAIAIVGLAAGVALARPGGGEGFSGGGGHGGGGGGGGGDSSFVFELIYWTLRLIIYYPQIGLPILGIVAFFVIRQAYKNHQNRDWDSGPPVELKRSADLSRMLDVDPDFSQVVFEDFAFRLFSTAHRARHSEKTLASIAPYVSPAAQQALATRAPTGVPVTQVIVGALRCFRVDVPGSENGQALPGTRVRIGVEYEANVLTAEHTYYSVETWLFGRDATRHSKPPSTAHTFPCPNCGAPWQAADTGTQVCASCGQAVDNGRFDWVVEQISLASCDERSPSLTKEVPERGTDLPTYRAGDRDDEWDELVARDPALTEKTFELRLAMIYDHLNKAWAANELAPVRGLVSDGLYDYLAYWIDAYKRQKLRNQLTDMRITQVEYAKVKRDKYYDAITIRIWGTGKDFVINTDTGKLMRGSKHSERPYSEYWTLIRSAGRTGKPKAEPVCGNCGAPLKITMAGACDHCGAHLTAGEFDWVLSKIEQDDTYRG